MSTNGAYSAPTLNELLAAKNEKAALSLIKKGGIDLKESDSSGLSPIHWAANQGFKKVFAALVKRDVSPFTPDQHGYAPYYHATIQQREDFLDFFHKNYPLSLPKSTTTSFNQDVDNALRNCGLHSFSIKLPTFEDSTAEEIDDNVEKIIVSDKKKQTAIFLRSLFTPITLDANKRKSDSKSESLTELTPAFLSQIAYGLVEEMHPLEILKILTQDYKEMTWEAKLSCIYLIKELIRIDNKNEWIATPKFQAALEKFLYPLSNVIAMASLTAKIKQLYKHNLITSIDYHQSAAALSFDLAKAFTAATLQLTPQNFLAVNILKKAENNSAFQAVSTLTNKLSQIVCMDILLAPTIEIAIQRYTFYLDVIKHCLKEETSSTRNNMPYNFAAAFAIYTGLQFNALRRLECINQRLLAEDKQKLQKYDGISQRLQKYDRLFSNQGAFKALRDLMNQFPECIPLIAIYSADKDKISENTKLADRIMLFGKLNQKFSEHFDYLCTLQHLNATPYRTDFMGQLEDFVYSERGTYWYSYQLEPAKIIQLDEPLDLTKLETALKFCKDIHAPLVVEQASKRYSGKEAKKLLSNHLVKQAAPQETVDIIIKLCKVIIKNFKADMPKSELVDVSPNRSFQKSNANRKHSDTDTIIELTTSIKQLSLESSPSPLRTSRSRSHTTIMGTITPRHERRKTETSPQKRRSPISSSSEQRDDSISLEPIPEIGELSLDSFSPRYTPLALASAKQRKKDSFSSSFSEEKDSQTKPPSSKKALERK
ncbi:MAG: RasGEF domain-containing protein [Candidatus Berkiella sp.]